MIKKNNKKIISFIIIFIIIVFIIFKITKSKKFEFQEDLIFFKLFEIGQQKEDKNQENKYEIEVIKGKENYQKINLSQSIDIKTLVNKKILPGTKGSFYIFLTSNDKLNYEIEIVDKNEKPKNFKFEISKKEGMIEKNEVKKIEVKWEWPYEINEKEDIQDTKDGENIEEYKFEIYTIGK